MKYLVPPDPCLVFILHVCFWKRAFGDKWQVFNEPDAEPPVSRHWRTVWCLLW